MLRPPKMAASAKINEPSESTGYLAEEQIGFLLRVAIQRHTAIFTSRMVNSLTQAQLAALTTLYNKKPCAHNELGQLICVDAATVKGVVDRLRARGFVKSRTNSVDRRSRTITLTAKGRRLVEKALPYARQITKETLKPLSAEERRALMNLLTRLS
jgi:DNA-binding MarR family transcriptional regulator